MPTRIAAISDDLSSDFVDAAKVAADLGIDGLAIRHVDGQNIRELSLESLLAVRRIADDCGIAISAVSSPLGRDLHLGDDDGPALELLDRMIDAADALGSSLVRAFALWIPGKDALQHWWERPAELPQEVVDRVGGYAQRAERAGVTLMLELEGASYVGQVAEARALFDAICSPALALCWDVCNGWWSGEIPRDQGAPVARTLPIADVQFKDVSAGADGRPEFNQVVLGRGDIPYRDIVDGLLADGYDGWFTAERVYHPRKPELDGALRADIVADVSGIRRLLTA